MAKEFTYRGMTIGELQKLDMKEFMTLLPARERRSLKRGLTEEEKKIIASIAGGRRELRTHCRDLIIIPLMVGTVIRVHSGKEFVPVRIEPDMLGHRLGEFALTRRKVSHSAPGIGATRSSAALSVR